jgi:hypothetical protein
VRRRLDHVLPVSTGDGARRFVTCIYCRLVIGYADTDVKIVSDLFASHWADDHHLPGWRDAAAEARDRLWRRHPDLLEKLANRMSSAGDRAS